MICRGTATLCVLFHFISHTSVLLLNPWCLKKRLDWSECRLTPSTTRDYPGLFTPRYDTIRRLTCSALSLPEVTRKTLKKENYKLMNSPSHSKVHGGKGLRDRRVLGFMLKSEKWRHEKLGGSLNDVIIMTRKKPAT